ncbi:MAG: shikimate dehydrogenase [Candidatus Aureabacteria bacterium]|nr:shikimate dehydrogenase [Candidatus Auribacterota bacterium]
MTSKYAVIGWPLGHSMSPAIHNASFLALGIPEHFEARPISPAEFDRFMRALPGGPLKGVAVTIPYKTDVLRFCASLSPEAVAIGAANTLRVDGGGIRAFNTDAGAAVRVLSEAGVRLKGKRAVVLGAGGAARAICVELLREGVDSLVIANRTLARGTALRDELLRVAPHATVGTVPLNGDELRDVTGAADLLVNTTSVGMYPRVEESPVERPLLRKGLAVMDIVYNPIETTLLKYAREAGAVAIPGTEMLLHQAVEQERIWLGVEPPLGVMREALLSELSRGA